MSHVVSLDESSPHVPTLYTAFLTGAIHQPLATGKPSDTILSNLKRLEACLLLECHDISNASTGIKSHDTLTTIVQAIPVRSDLVNKAICRLIVTLQPCNKSCFPFIIFHSSRYLDNCIHLYVSFCDRYCNTCTHIHDGARSCVASKHTPSIE